jgi:hypothetical protein
MGGLIAAGYLLSDRPRPDLTVLSAPGRCPVQVVQLRIETQRRRFNPCLKEVPQFSPSGNGGCAAMTRDNKRAAGIAPGEGFRQRFILYITAQEARHEPVAGTEHVVDLDRKSRTNHALFKAVRNSFRKRHRAYGSAFHHDQRGCDCAYFPQRLDCVGAPAGDVDLLLSADDHIAAGQD